MTIKATEVQAEPWVLLETGVHSSREEGVVTGVIAPVVRRHTGAPTSPAAVTHPHSIDFGGPDIIEIATAIRASTHSTILEEEHRFHKAMGLGMIRIRVNTFERNRWERCSSDGSVFSDPAQNNQASSSKTESLARCMASSLVNQNVGVSPKSLSQR